jgi:hypothetical protein
MLPKEISLALKKGSDSFVLPFPHTHGIPISAVVSFHKRDYVSNSSHNDAPFLPFSDCVADPFFSSIINLVHDCLTVVSFQHIKADGTNLLLRVKMVESDERGLVWAFLMARLVKAGPFTLLAYAVVVLATTTPLWLLLVRRIPSEWGTGEAQSGDAGAVKDRDSDLVGGQETPRFITPSSSPLAYSPVSSLVRTLRRPHAASNHIQGLRKDKDDAKYEVREK